MPVVITYELEGAETSQHNRVQSFFERLGWENLGGSSYRYPKLGTDQPTEDWFNHVVPALLLFRSFIISSKVALKKFTIDSQSSTGYNPTRGYGTPPLPTNDPKFVLYDPTNQAFGKKNLTKWIDGIGYAY